MIWLKTYGSNDPEIFNFFTPFLPRIVGDAIGSASGIPFPNPRLEVKRLPDGSPLSGGLDVMFATEMSIPFWHRASIVAQNVIVESVGSAIKRLVPEGTTFLVVSQLVPVPSKNGLAFSAGIPTNHPAWKGVPVIPTGIKRFMA